MFSQFSKLYEQDNLLFGGPFTDIDSGGVMIAKGATSREELEELAVSDPALIAGLLKFEVNT